MRRPQLLLAILIVLSMMFVSERVTQRDEDLAESVVYALLPWTVGLFCTLLKIIWDKVRAETPQFHWVLLISTTITFLLVGGWTLTHPSATRQKVLHDDAIHLMGSGLFVPTMAGYCEKFVEPNPALIAAATDWNKRNAAFMDRIIETLKWTGGWTEDEKNGYDRGTVATIKRMVDSSEDRAAFCRSQIDILRDEKSDLDKNEVTAPLLRRVMNATLN